MHNLLNNFNILVVDDDKDNLKFLGRFLSEEGYSVKTSNHPLGVAQEVKENLYQMVLLDLRMPELDGLEVLRQIRIINSSLCVIIVTGYPSVESVVEAMKNRAYDYLIKPLSIPQLKGTIERAIKEFGLALDPIEELNKRIGKNVRLLRKDQQLTLKQLANKTGLSTSLISQIELAKTSASVATLYKLAAILKVGVESFFTP